MPTSWQATAEHTTPANSTMVAGQIKEYTYDASTDLGDGQAPENPAVSLIRLDTLAVVEDGAVLDTPAIAGNVISLKVAGVERGVTYELRIAFDHTNPRVAGERTVKLHIVECVG